MSLKLVNKLLFSLVFLQALALFIGVSRIKKHVDLYYVEGYMVYSNTNPDTINPMKYVTFDTIRYESCKPHLTYEQAQMELEEQQNFFNDEYSQTEQGITPVAIRLKVINYAE